MGIAFSHCKAQWSYSGFNEFRHRLAKLIDLNLDDMVGYGGKVEWESIPPDDIIDLLHHSDCDGYLTPKQSLVISARLEELVEGLKYDNLSKIEDNNSPDIVKKWKVYLGENYFPSLLQVLNHDYSNCQLLISGMKEAALNNEELRFF